MIMKGESLEKQAFRPYYIYNSYKKTCQQQAVNPPVLGRL